MAVPHPATAQTTGASFVENFDKLDRGRWYISDGWSNGAHQNCAWSKGQVSVSDGEALVVGRRGMLFFPSLTQPVEGVVRWEGGACRFSAGPGGDQPAAEALAHPRPVDCRDLAPA